MGNESVLTDLNKVEKKILSLGCKFLRLQTLDGSPVVSFNMVGKPWKPKFTEIVRRMPTLPDGIYNFQCQDNISKGAFSHSVLYGKGKFEPLSENPPVKQLAEIRSESPLLSVESAMENVKASANALAENSFLKQENERLKKDLADCNTKLEALKYLEEEEEETEEPSAGLSWLKETVPALLPLADRFFEMEEKKLALQEKKFLHEKGYEIPGVQKRKETNALPPIGSPDFARLVEEITNLPDEKFDFVMKQLQTQSPAHYNAILPLVWEEEETQKETNE